MGELVIVLRPRMALAYGINRAALLSQLHYLTTHPPKNALYGADGRVWIPASYETWQRVFLWMSKSGIRKAFEYLHQQGLVQSSMSLHMKWYSLTPEGMAQFQKLGVQANDLGANLDAWDQSPIPADQIPKELRGCRPVSAAGIVPTTTAKATSAPKRTSKGVSRSSTPLTASDTSKCPSGAVSSYSIEDSKKEESDSLSTHADDPAFQEFLQVFAEVCEMNPRLPSHHKKMIAYVVELWDAGYTCDDLRAVPVYWHNDDFRKGRMYPNQVVELIEAAVRRYGRRSSNPIMVQTNLPLENPPQPAGELVSDTTVPASTTATSGPAPSSALMVTAAAQPEPADPLPQPYPSLNGMPPPKGSSDGYTYTPDPLTHPANHDPQPTVARRIMPISTLSPLEQGWEMAKQAVQMSVNAATYDYLVDPLVVVDYIEGVIRIRCFPQVQARVAEGFARALLRACRRQPMFATAHSILIEAQDMAPMRVTPDLPEVQAPSVAAVPNKRHVSGVMAAAGRG